MQMPWLFCISLYFLMYFSLACRVFLSLEQGKTLLVVCKCLDYDQSCIRYGHFTPHSQITLKIVWSRPWKLSPNKRQLHNINSNKYQSSGATTAPEPKLSDFATGNSLITSLFFEMANGKLFYHAKHNSLYDEEKWSCLGINPVPLVKQNWKLFISEVLTLIAIPWVLQNLMCGPMCVLCVPTEALKTRVFNGNNWPWRW